MNGRRLLKTGLLLALLLTCCTSAPGAVVPASAQVRLLVSNALPYRGQELVLTLELRYRRRPPGPLQVVWPALDAFAVDELPPPPPRSLAPPGQPGEIVEGQRLLLRPLTSGRVSLQGAGVRLGNGRLLPAPPLELRVRPLPAAGRPDDFGGGVGRLRLDLESAGSGLREIAVRVTGNAWLEALSPPQLTVPSGSRLIPLGETRAGRPGQLRSRSWRYLFDPGSDPAALPGARLISFDPNTESYRLLQAGVRDSSFLPLGGMVFLALVLLLAGGGYWRLRRRWKRLEVLLEELLGRPSRGLTETKLEKLLELRGAAPETLELWRQWRRAEECCRFAPVTSGPAANLPQLRRRLARALANDMLATNRNVRFCNK